jgi:hypothetical protein
MNKILSSLSNFYSVDYNKTLSNKEFLHLFLTFFIIIFIINIIIFSIYPEQYYTIYDINPLPEGVSLPVFTSTIISSDKKFILQAPDNLAGRILDSFYFTISQFSTIGYGDITAKYATSKIICSITNIFIILLSFKFINHQYHSQNK